VGNPFFTACDSEDDQPDWGGGSDDGNASVSSHADRAARLAMMQDIFKVPNDHSLPGGSSPATLGWRRSPWCWSGASTWWRANAETLPFEKQKLLHPKHLDHWKKDPANAEIRAKARSGGQGSTKTFLRLRSAHRAWCRKRYGSRDWM